MTDPQWADFPERIFDPDKDGWFGPKYHDINAEMQDYLDTRTPPPAPTSAKDRARAQHKRNAAAFAETAGDIFPETEDDQND